MYVDYMLVTCDTLFEVENIKELLLSEFDIKNLGEAKKILGMEIMRDRFKDVLYLSQRRYIEKLCNTSLWVMLKVCLLHLPLIFKLSKKLCPNKKRRRANGKNSIH